MAEEGKDMSQTSTPADRYILLRRGEPIFTTNDCDDLLHELIGHDIGDDYVVLDYERPYPVDTPNLFAWIERLRSAAGKEHPWRRNREA